MNRMEHKIVKVERDSIAWELGIRAGDVLLSVNGEDIVDLIDYKSLEAEEIITLRVRCGGREEEFEFEKDGEEGLGLVFENTLMSPMRTCANQCIFCFVDQLPDGTRESMHVKDDDWRLSFMMGNFVTLTNVTERELDRIIKRRVTPLYVSVHATDGDVRVRMLGNRNAGKIMNQLKKLADNGIEFHTQIVLCPGINDGEILRRSLEDLAKLRPSCLSCAVVPVGLTSHRAGLDELRRPDGECAREVIRAVEEIEKKTGGFAYASDEFYLLAEKDALQIDYGTYDQLDNGVGMLRLMWDEVLDGVERLRRTKADGKKTAVVTGEAAYPFICRCCDKVRQAFPNINVTVFAVKNDYFGQSVTVSGLITGTDVVKQVSKGFDRVLLPSNMLRPGTETFLDGTCIDDVVRGLDAEVRVADSYGSDFVAQLLGVEENFF